MWMFAFLDPFSAGSAESLSAMDPGEGGARAQEWQTRDRKEMHGSDAYGIVE